MDPENVINLFDSYWFDYEILKNNKSYSPKNKSSSSPKFSSLRSILVRSKSEDISSSFNYGSFSPSSVLFTSNLKTINSGKLDDIKIEKPEQKREQEENTDKRVLVETKKSRKQSGTSKSLSELEFEELKGFMDLGFVFSEEDKDDSSLVEIIPGLQRLGEERESKDYSYSSSSSTSATSRPYLSEAWKDLDRRINYHALMMNWEIPAVKDEIDMKDNLKLWAHTVASFVR